MSGYKSISKKPQMVPASSVSSAGKTAKRALSPHAESRPRKIGRKTINQDDLPCTPATGNADNEIADPDSDGEYIDDEEADAASDAEEDEAFVEEDVIREAEVEAPPHAEQVQPEPHSNSRGSETVKKLTPKIDYGPEPDMRRLLRRLKISQEQADTNAKRYNLVIYKVLSELKACVEDTGSPYEWTGP